MRRARNSTANRAVIRNGEASNGPLPFELQRPPEVVGSSSGVSTSGAGSDGSPSTVVGLTMTSGSAVGSTVGVGGMGVLVGSGVGSVPVSPTAIPPLTGVSVRSLYSVSAPDSASAVGVGVGGTYGSAPMLARHSLSSCCTVLP